MGKVEINNEIIVLRQPVRQARVCVINKLIREAKKLRGKQGNEKQMEKNKRKADKFLKEVYALKLIKDDDITKFGILQSDKLRDILQDPSTDDKKRVMAKVAQYKTLSARIAEFVEKFPDYEIHLASKKKKNKKQPNKEPSKNKTGDDLAASAESKTNETSERVPDLDSEGGTSTKHTDPDTEHEPPQKMRLRDRKRVSPPGEEISEDTPSKVSEEEAGKHPERDKPGEKKSCNVRSENDTKIETDGETTSFKVIGEEATVKRFADLLRETDAVESQNCPETEHLESTKGAKAVERRVDDFFMNSEGNPVETMDVNPRERLRGRDADHRREATDNFPRRQSGRQEKKFSSGAAVRFGGREKRKNQDDPRTRGPPLGDFSKQKKKKFEAEKKLKTRDISGTCAEENESLHPSWAARKKQQEVMKQGFQGKKIVFDED